MGGVQRWEGLRGVGRKAGDMGQGAGRAQPQPRDPQGHAGLQQHGPAGVEIEGPLADVPTLGLDGAHQAGNARELPRRALRRR